MMVQLVCCSHLHLLRCRKFTKFRDAYDVRLEDSWEGDVLVPHDFSNAKWDRVKACVTGIDSLLTSVGTTMYHFPMLLFFKLRESIFLQTHEFHIGLPLEEKYGYFFVVLVIRFIKSLFAGSEIHSGQSYICLGAQ